MIGKCSLPEAFTVRTEKIGPVLINACYLLPLSYSPSHQYLYQHIIRNLPNLTYLFFFFFIPLILLPSLIPFFHQFNFSRRRSFFQSVRPQTDNTSTLLFYYLIHHKFKRMDRMGSHIRAHLLLPYSVGRLQA